MKYHVCIPETSPEILDRYANIKAQTYTPLFYYDPHITSSIFHDAAFNCFVIINLSDKDVIYLTLSGAHVFTAETRVVSPATLKKLRNIYVIHKLTFLYRFYRRIMKL